MFWIYFAIGLVFAITLVFFYCIREKKGHATPGFIKDVLERFDIDDEMSLGLAIMVLIIMWPVFVCLAIIFSGTAAIILIGMFIANIFIKIVNKIIGNVDK